METTQGIGTKVETEPSLEAAWRKFNDAFNRFDVDGVVAFWAEDGTLITPTGEVGKGRAGVEAAYRHDCDTILRGTSSTFTISGVRRLGNDLALVDLDHELRNVRKPDGTTGTMQMHVAVLAKRSGSTWQWVDVRPYALLPRPPSIH